MLACIFASVIFSQMAGRRTIVFVDNTATEFAFSKGSGRTQGYAWLPCLYWQAEAEEVSSSCAFRVSSPSNPAAALPKLKEPLIWETPLIDCGLLKGFEGFMCIHFCPEVGPAGRG